MRTYSINGKIIDEAEASIPVSDHGFLYGDGVFEGLRFYDNQVLKLQDPPDEVPAGELPRHILLSVDRALVDSVAPGTRVSVMGVIM